jgi:hypothetical protein
MGMKKIAAWILAGRAVEPSLRNPTGAEEEGKDQNKEAKSEKDVVPIPQADRADQVAQANSFTAGKKTQTDEAADVDECAVNGPPIAGFTPGRGAAKS